MQEATELGKRAKEIKDAALALQREERAGSKGRKWKKNVNKVQQVWSWFKKAIFLCFLLVEPVRTMHSCF